MKTVVIASQKGGSTKTTLCVSLAVEAERCGDGPAWLIDTDPQGTLSKWHDRREAELPQRAEVPFAQLSNGLAALANAGVAYCFIDTPPAVTDQTAAALEVADLVIIPVRPSPLDLWAASETVALVQKAQKPFLFVITQAKANATITAQTVAALSHHGRVAKSFIGDRVPYAAAMTDGRAAQELAAQGPAALELGGLWKDVKACFHENVISNKRRSAAHG
jgi:chromosome partitioning protein